MTEIHLMQTGFTYSSSGLFRKCKEIMQKFKKSRRFTIHLSKRNR